ncbi:MAG: MoaD/ThiS family protein [Desulfofustis sp.]|jgi:sulfur carrier protein ThiS
MDVDVTLFPPLREHRFSKSAVTLAEPATVQSVLDALAIDGQDVEAVYVNGREATLTKTLKAGDRITFLPFIGGG